PTPIHIVTLSLHDALPISPRFSGSASGLMNTGSALAAIVSPLVFGHVIDKTGDWTLPFLGTIGLLLIGAMLVFWMTPDEELPGRSEEHTSELQSLRHLVCR